MPFRLLPAAILVAGSFVFALGFLLPAVAPADAQARVLIYSGTTGVRHAGGAGATAQAISQPAINALTTALADAGHPADWVDCNGAGTAVGQCQHPAANPAVFTAEGLAPYDAILLFNATSATANPLWTTGQRDAIKAWVQTGGGIAAVHAAVDMGNGSQTWDWWDGGNESAVGTTVSSRTAATTEANIQIADGHHQSTRNLPDSYEFTDEHYTFASNVRGRAHVLATRNANAPASTNTLTGDNPISWCKPYDGGRVWVTGMGHFESAFTANGGANNLVRHVVGGTRWAAGDGQDGDCGGTIWSNFSRTILGMTNGPISIDITDDGVVYWTEIGTTGQNGVGRVKVYDPVTEQVSDVATIGTRTGQGEDGLLGLALAPDFNDSRHIYIYYSPRIPGGLPAGTVTINDTNAYNVLSRFTVAADGKSFVEGSEQQILRVPMAKFDSGDGMICGGPGHVGGASVVFDSEGDLYIGIGDDVDPNCGASGASGGAPIDQRFPERYDARNTSANTNNFRGAVLRIKPKPDASGTPGIGNTYTIPEGNMFPPGTPLTKPEIYAKGFRQPFTVHVDPANPGTVVVGEYGPDSNGAGRGPSRPIEWNYIREPGFFGWPYCTGDNTLANSYNRWQHPDGPAGDKFDCSLSQIPNESNFNTGQPSMPGPAKQAAFYISGSSPITGPIYRHDPTSQSSTRWPAYYDGSWLFFERNQFFREGRIRQDNRNILRYNTMFSTGQFGSPSLNFPIPTRFGPDGSLYMGVWINGCCRGAENTATAIMRIDYLANEVTEDTVPPTAEHELTGNMQGPAYVNHATLKLTGKDNYAGSGLARLEYSTDGGSNWITYSSPVSFGPGSHTVRYRAIDNFENASVPVVLPINVVAVADHDPPVVTHQIQGNQNVHGQYLTGVTLSFSATDVLSTVASIEYRINGGAWQEFTIGTPVRFDDTGHYEVQYRATDTAPTPNTSAPATVEFSAVPACVGDYSDEFNGTALDTAKWDFMHPTTLPADVSIGGGALTLKTGNGEIDNTANGPATFVGRPLPPGDQWTATAKLTMDHAESWQTGGLMIYQSDVNVLRVSYTHNNGSPGVTFLESQRDDPPGGGRASGGGVGSSATNPNSVLIRLVRSGNNLTASYSWDVDAATPNWLNIPLPSGGFPFDTDPRRDGPDVRIGLIAGGNMAGGPKIDVAYDWFRVDVPGAAVDCEPTDVRAPTVAHQVAPAAPTGNNGWYRDAPTVSLAATDDFAAPEDLEIEFRLGSSGAWTPYVDTAPLLLSADGIHTVEYRAADPAGNTSAVRSVEMKVDAAAPTVVSSTVPASPDAPQGGWNVGSGFTASAVDPHSGIASVEYNSGSGWLPYSAGSPPVFDQPGSYVIQVRATDAAGNVGTAPNLGLVIAPPILEPVEGVGSVSIALPEAGYSGPPITRTMYRVTRGGPGTGALFMEYVQPLVLNLPGQYVLEYFHEHAGGGTSPVYTRDVIVVAPARLAWSVTPKKLKLAPGKSKVLKVKLVNRGGVQSSAGRLCASAPKRKLKVPGRCAAVPVLASGASRIVRVRVTARAGFAKGNSAKITLRMRHPEGSPGARRVTARDGS